MAVEQCSAILKSGKRKGQTCSSSARYHNETGKPVCGRHRPVRKASHRQATIKEYRLPPLGLQYLLLKGNIYGYLDRTQNFRRISSFQGHHCLKTIIRLDSRLETFRPKRHCRQVGSLLYNCDYGPSCSRIEVTIIDLNSMRVIDTREVDVSFDTCYQRDDLIILTQRQRVLVIDLTETLTVQEVTTDLREYRNPMLVKRDDGYTILEAPLPDVTNGQLDLIDHSNDGLVVVINSIVPGKRFNRSEYYLIVNGEGMTRTNNYLTIHCNGCYVVEKNKIWFPHLPGGSPVMVPPNCQPIFNKACRACRVQLSLQKRCAEIIKIRNLDHSVIPKIVRDQFHLS